MYLPFITKTYHFLKEIIFGIGNIIKVRRNKLIDIRLPNFYDKN